MKFEYLQSKGLNVLITKINDFNRTFYEVTLFRGNDSVMTTCTAEGLYENIEVIYQDLFFKFILLQKRNTEQRNKLELKNKRCECGSKEYLQEYKEKWICDKCLFFLDEECPD